VARRVDIDRDEIEVTRGEKVLALMLAAFVFVGLIWGYDKLDVRGGPYGLEAVSAADQAAIDRALNAEADLGQAQATRVRALEDLELRREAYRTALDAGQPAQSLERQYREAQRSLARSEQIEQRARARVRASAAAADEARRRATASSDEQRRDDAQITFLLRVGYALLALGLAYALLLALRGSRYFTIALACVGAAAALSLTVAADYVEDYVEWQQAGPLVLSIAGIALTLAALWALQRYLQRRIPVRRVRKGECPFCGFPVRANARCEGCGRQVLAPCSTCGEPRRVGVAHCGTCGNA